MRVEVGLLSRNIVIQGARGSSRQLFGVHVVAVHGAKLRLTSTEVRFCGQFGVLGRYCTHFHMANKQEDAYIIDNSIHDSFQRAVTIHGTHYSRVANNVAFRVRGHTFFVEDGAETNNVIENNLAVATFCSEVRLSVCARACALWRVASRFTCVRWGCGVPTAAGSADRRHPPRQLLEQHAQQHLATQRRGGLLRLWLLVRVPRQPRRCVGHH
jgi:hypothetical protein